MHSKPKMIIELTVSQQEMKRNMTTPSLAISISRSPLRLGLPLIPLAGNVYDQDGGDGGSD
jgi:hypothetical protein